MSTFGFNQYDALPGHKVGFKDGNLNLKNDPNGATTESVVFLGTATDGPVHQPIRVTPENAFAIFGTNVHDNGIANGATLLNAFEEAWLAGNRDIRLMRVTGKNSVTSLAGTPYTETRQEIASKEFVAQGNEAIDYTLPHGGIVDGTLVVKANGVNIPAAAYTADLGTAEVKGYDVDGITEIVVTPEVKGAIQLLQDVVDMEAEINVDYQYTVTDAEGVVDTFEVIDNNTDSLGQPMIAFGHEVTFTLDHVAKLGAKVYVNDMELLDKNAFTITGDKFTIKSTSKINLKDGVEVSYSYDAQEIVNPTIELESVYGGSKYNSVKRKVEKDADGIVTITITKPDSKKAIMSEQPLKFRSVDFANFQLMVNAINTHPLNNVVRASTSAKHASQLTDSLTVSVESFMSGGSDELNLTKEQMYVKLGGLKDSEGYVVDQGAYQILENYTVDYVVPLGVFADDKLTGKYDNFAYQLALGCAVMSHYNSVTIGLVNTTTPDTTSLKDIEAKVVELEALDNSFYMRDRFGAVIKDGEGNSIDLGQFIQVIAGPEPVVSNSRLGATASNTAASYVGFVSQLLVQSAPTNKAMPSVRGLRFEYSSAQLNRLTKARYVTYKVKPNGTIGIVDAMTAAHVGSDYTRLSTARIVKEAVNQVREVADPFIGEPNDTPNRNALASALDKRLGRMVENKALLDYEFQVISTPQMELIGEATIELTLRAPNELRNLTTIVGLQA